MLSFQYDIFFQAISRHDRLEYWNLWSILLFIKGVYDSPWKACKNWKFLYRLMVLQIAKSRRFCSLTQVFKGRLQWKSILNVLNLVILTFPGRNVTFGRLESWRHPLVDIEVCSMILLKPVRNDFLSQVAGMTSSYRRQKKSVQQKTKQRLNAKEVLSATGYLKNLQFRSLWWDVYFQV